MSLPLIAKHLEQHGRGEDTHLVHMTTGELRAMQKLAESRGGSLTINPHTGLPEAGFLSSALPMVLDAAAAVSGQEWAVPLAMALSAGGEYAMTGSLTQGLMAGLGAWGGAGLAGGIAGLGADAAVQAGGDTAAQQFAASQSAAIGGGGATLPQGVVPTETGAFNTITGTEVTPQSVAAQQIQGMSNLPAAAQSGYVSALQAPAADVNGIINSAGQANAALGSTPLSNLQSGLTSGHLMDYAGSHLGQVAAVASPLISGASSLFKQPSNPPGVTQQTSSNPFGMKTIPKDSNGNPIFNASLPTPPAHPYQATYPNYVQNPYNPYATATAKRGGLMDIPKYSGADYGSMVTGAQEMQQGLDQATKPKQLSDMQKALIEAGNENSKNGVYSLSDTEYAKMTPAALMKKYKIPLAKGVEPVGTLGDYETKPSAQAAAEQAAQADIAQSQQKTSAKEGGLMAMASGGSPVYHAQYQNYHSSQVPQAPVSQAPQAAPVAIPAESLQANQQATSALQKLMANPSQGVSQAPVQAFQPATPTFTRPNAPSPSGYAIDPTIMQGSPAYIKAQAEIQQASQNPFDDAGFQAWQRQQYLNSLNSSGGGGSGGGASGGLPKDFKKFAMGGGIQDGHLGSYSDGGRLLKGPGDGVSDGIPATIGGKQPARLADGEFVIPARIVSELGNGSTDAGAKRLYAMMDRIKHARKKAKDIAADTKAYKYLPA
jgi:hypothetical protein